MPDHLELAIRNFVGHCQAIPAALGSTGTQTEVFSENQHTFNIPYPNGIIHGGANQSEAQLAQIQHLLTTRPTNQSTSVVDSYNTLDLKPLGFEILFDSPWSYRTASPVAPAAVPAPKIESVITPDQLEEFDRSAAVGFYQPTADRVYSTPLLNDTRYAFHFIRHSGEIVAGVQTFTNDESVGIYTLFTLPNHQRKGFASALVRHVLARSPNLSAITNPGDQSDHLFRSAVFTQIGTRTIWIHNPT